MAKRPKLRMTNADYVAIAVSPALIMALVGSLVFFLIEVLYVGEYPARVTYVFALFVFATVLIARIAIEDGNDHAAMFAIPLGLAMFVVLAKFVEHASPLAPLINIGLLGIVWWSAHKLTINCTLIDDNEDASGEGLMQHIGVDEVSEEASDGKKTQAAPVANELLADTSSPKEKAKPPHTPGLWVLYFSLAALPLFGIGQKWIPTNDVGSRRYAFGLLFVYVAAGLALLVTTSFLGLRRYLRQRRVEMPGPMAVTWIATGGILIIIVMLLAALIPRPSAEYAISQVPWQASSREDLTASRTSFGDEGTEDDDSDADKILNDETDPDATAVREGENPTEASEKGEKQSSSDGKKGDDDESERGEQSENNDSQQGEQSEQNESDKSNSQQKQESNEDSSEPNNDAEQSPEQQLDEKQSNDNESARSQPEAPSETSANEETAEKDNKEPEQDDAQEDGNSGSSPSRSPSLPDLSTITGGLTGLLKIILYAAIAFALGYLAWKNRREIKQAISELIQMLRDLIARLFGKEPAKPASDASDASDANDETKQPSGPPPRALASFADPFANRQHRILPPDELVHYTFEAFEAWAREHGFPHSPDQTPGELIRLAVPPQSPLYIEAKQLARLYNEAAYAPGTVSAADVACLAQLWTLLRRSPAQPPQAASKANST